MKKTFTKFLAALMLLAIFTPSMIAVGQNSGNYTITAKTGSGDGTNITTSTTVSSVFTATTYPHAFTTATKASYAGSNGIKLGTSSASGELTFSLEDAGKVYATTIVVNAKLYNSGKAATISVNGKTSQSMTADFADYTFNIGENIESITLTSSKYCWVNSITVNYGSVPTTACDIALTNAPVALSFDLFNNTTPQVISYTTSSTGTVSVESNSYVDATVDQVAKTITVTPKAITNGSAQTITVHQEADDTYLAGTAQFTVNITDSTPEPNYVFNTDDGLEALGITKPEASQGTDLVANHNYVSGDITMNITHGTTNTRVWGGTTTTDLRVYAGGGSLIFSVPSGYVITRIILTGTAVNAFGNDVSDGIWSGTASRTVTLTANNTAKINTITIAYEANTSGVDAPELPAACNFVNEKEITITCATAGATIYYTTDNADPRTSSSRIEYSAPFTINTTTTVNAVACLSSNYSNVVTVTYTIVYTISLNQTTGGTISSNKSQAAEGETITLTATPNVGYSFSSWSVIPATVTISNNSFTMPAENVTASATFTASSASSTISFSINNKVEMTATIYGGSIDLTKFVANPTTEGYNFDGWSTTLGGSAITGQTSYTPSGDVTLYPVFSQPAADDYTLVTNTNQLEAGNLVVIAASGYDYAISKTQNNNNRGAAAITKGTSIINELSENVCEFALGAGTKSNTWSFYDANLNKYLCAASSSSNYLRSQETNDDNGSFTISVTNAGVATITAQGTYTRNIIRYNASNNPSIFACYGSSTTNMKDVCIYTKPASSKSTRDNVTATSNITGIAAGVKVTVKNGGIVYLTGSNAGNEANLIVEDGGQLITSDAVKGTMQKSVTGYGSASDPSNYYFISTPLNASTNPKNVEHMINTAGYDLYYFNQEAELEWRNYKAAGEQGFNLYVGSGYLYANRESLTLSFAGTLRNSNTDYSKNLTYYDTNPDENMHGWNLIGNPFSANASIPLDRDYYVMKPDGTEIVAGTTHIVAPMEGIFVHAAAADPAESVTFTVSGSAKRSSYSRVILNIVDNNSNVIDRAIVNLNEGGTLPKFMIDESNTKVYIPQEDNNYAVVCSNDKGSMPVNFKAKEMGMFTISVETEGIDLSYLHLIDRLTGEDIDLLLDSKYSFIASNSDMESRFILSFGENGISASNETFAFQSGSDIIVNGEGELQIFDVMGRMVKNTTINGVEAITMPQGVYVCKLNGNVQKIVVR